MKNYGNCFGTTKDHEELQKQNPLLRGPYRLLAVKPLLLFAVGVIYDWNA